MQKATRIIGAVWVVASALGLWLTWATKSTEINASPALDLMDQLTFFILVAIFAIGGVMVYTGRARLLGEGKPIADPARSRKNYLIAIVLVSVAGVVMIFADGAFTSADIITATLWVILGTSLLWSYLAAVHALKSE